ncbi:MAG TPA: MFS transporter [Chthonomonadales bacterium]|nr:MFS transporter [Chthonomonadales bacterium]
MTASVRWRLTVMMVLQYAVWGAWVVVAGKYLMDEPPHGLGFDGVQVGFIFSLLPLATIISPFIAGQIADRYMNTEKFLAILHLVGGFLMFAMARQTDYQTFAIMMFAYSLFYAPTLALSNSITFAHLTSAERQFGGIRVGGTIGWILAGWALAAWRSMAETPFVGDLFFLAGGISIVLGLFSFALPATPPRREGANPLAFMEALKLLKSRPFLVFMIISFVVGTELQFYYILTAPFLGTPVQFGGIGIPSASISAYMSIAQVAEIAVMLSLPLILPKLGIRKTLLLGILAWPIRYAIFSLLPIPWLVLASLTLHGFCYVFFFVVGFIYVDKVAPKDIRASAQALVALVVLGLAPYVGSIFAGWIQAIYTTDLAQPVTVGGQLIGSVTNWKMVFMIPCVLTILCAIVFPLLFREDPRGAESDDTAKPA